MQAQHLPHAAHAPHIPMAPHPSGLPGMPSLPPTSSAAAAGLLGLGGLPGVGHLPGIKDEKSEYRNRSSPRGKFDLDFCVTLKLTGGLFGYPSFEVINYKSSITIAKLLLIFKDVESDDAGEKTTNTFTAWFLFVKNQITSFRVTSYFHHVY